MPSPSSLQAPLSSRSSCELPPQVKWWMAAGLKILFPLLSSFPTAASLFPWWAVFFAHFTRPTRPWHRPGYQERRHSPPARKKGEEHMSQARRATLDRVGNDPVERRSAAVGTSTESCAAGRSGGQWALEPTSDQISRCRSDGIASPGWLAADWSSPAGSGLGGGRLLGKRSGIHSRYRRHNARSVEGF